MLSRSPKRSLVMNWWCVGTMLVCRLDAVSASSCSRFSRRCSSKIFCQETRLNCLHPPDMGLYSFIHRSFVRHNTHVSLIQNTITFIKVFVFRGLIHEFCTERHQLWKFGLKLKKIHLFVPMTPPQHFILAFSVSWGGVWNRNRKAIIPWSVLTDHLKASFQTKEDGIAENSQFKWKKISKQYKKYNHAWFK